MVNWIMIQPSNYSGVSYYISSGFEVHATFAITTVLSIWLTHFWKCFQMETLSCSYSCNHRLHLSTNAAFLALSYSRACLHQSSVWLNLLESCFRNIPDECWEWSQRLLGTLTNVFLLLFAHRGCVQRRGVISRMFPTAESAFIITVNWD